MEGKKEKMDKKYDSLFKPFKIKDMELRNRIVMAPMHTKFASESGETTDRLISYLVERARGGVGLIILENTCIDWVYGRAAGNPITIHDNLNRSGLSNIALAVHRYGAKIVTQLHHTGRQNLRSNIVGGKAPIAPSPVKSKIGGDEPRALEEHEIEEIIQMYVDAAIRTKDAGFDGVELHGAHGYLLTQFFSPYTNRRNDKWGGSFKNRARFPLEVIRRIRAEVGPKFPILYRLSAEERIPGGTILEDTLKLVKLLDENGVDCFDITAGIYDSIEWIYTLQGVEPGSLIPLAESIKRVTSKPVIGVSRLGWDIGYAAKILQENKVDLISIGRSLLADPEIPKKTYEGRINEICPCLACNDCVAKQNQGWQLHCTVNPILGNEYLSLLNPVKISKNVVIIGGGPSGIQCAITAAQIGHKVTLLEKSKQLGGQLLGASKPQYKKKEIEALLRYYNIMLSGLGVNIKLNTKITEEAIQTIPELEKANVLICALGCVPAYPTFQGGEYAINALDLLLTNNEGVGENVIVVGASGVGIDTALFLKEKPDRKVKVLEQTDKIGGDLNEFLLRHTLTMAKEKDIEFYSNCRVEKIERGKVYADTLNGNKIFIADTIIAACGFVPLETEQMKKVFEKKGKQVFVIGSCASTCENKIFDATQSGFWTALEI